MDISEVDEYSRASGNNRILPIEQTPQLQNDNKLFPDNSINNVTYNLPSSSNLGMFFICKYLVNKYYILK